MAWWKRKKHKCLVCGRGVGDNAPILKYRYLGDDGQHAIDEVRMCNKCANSIPTAESDAFNEPF